MAASRLPLAYFRIRSVHELEFPQEQGKAILEVNARVTERGMATTR